MVTRKRNSNHHHHHRRHVMRRASLMKLLLFTLLPLLLLLTVQHSVDAWTVQAPLQSSSSSSSALSLSSSSSSSSSRGRRQVPLLILHASSSSSSSPPPPTQEEKTAASKKKKKQSRSSRLNPQQAILVEAEESPAGIEGAQFFGGKQEKEDLYDPMVEAQAGSSSMLFPDISSSSSSSSSPLVTTTTATATTTAPTATSSTTFDRFASTSNAFPDDLARNVARDLQLEMNRVLYDDVDVDNDDTTDNNGISMTRVQYAKNVDWLTPFTVGSSSKKDGGGDYNISTEMMMKKKQNPLTALADALDFYRRVDVAITAARCLSSSSSTINNNNNNNNNNEPIEMQMHWEISLVWPIFWQPRVLLTGTSTMKLQTTKSTTPINDDNIATTIVSQVDMLHGGGGGGGGGDDPKKMYDVLLSLVMNQVIPRFWDVYHIGMTPSAEASPKLIAKETSKSFLASYNIYDLPPRWMLQVGWLEPSSAERRDQNALVLPMHAFTAPAIKTMGAQRQRYIPTTPLEVQISRKRNGGSNDSNSSNNNNNNWLEWTIPIAVELESQCKWPLSSSLPPPAPAALSPSNDDDSQQNQLEAEDHSSIVQSTTATTDRDDDDNNDSALLMQRKSNNISPTSSSPSSSSSSTADITETLEYKWTGPRRVAVMAHAGMGPQDDTITKIRQELYTQVVERDGHRPKLDAETGRPIFLYWQNAFKGCYTEQGLGMAVYEWRPQWTKPGCVGIELEMD